MIEHYSAYICKDTGKLIRAIVTNEHGQVVRDIKYKRNDRRGRVWLTQL